MSAKLGGVCLLLGGMGHLCMGEQSDTSEPLEDWAEPGGERQGVALSEEKRI